MVVLSSSPCSVSRSCLYKRALLIGKANFDSADCTTCFYYVCMQFGAVSLENILENDQFVSDSLFLKGKKVQLSVFVYFQIALQTNDERNWICGTFIHSLAVLRLLLNLGTFSL